MPPGHEHDQPNAADDQRATKRESKHWLEYAIFTFVILTSLATGAAAWYAREQWLVSQDTEKRELRPYVGIAGFSAVHVPFDGGAYLIYAIWENFGSTPTLKAVMTTHQAIMAAGPVCPDFAASVRHPVPSLLVPHQQTDSAPFIVHDEDALAAMRGEEFVYFWTRVEYNDPFPQTQRHITRICRRLVGILPLAGGKFEVDVRTCKPEGDCADSGCEKGS